MAKTTISQRNAATSSAAALAAVMFAAPGLAVPAPAPEQQAQPIPQAEFPAHKVADAKHASTAKALNFSKIKTEYKLKGAYSIAGLDQGHVVFEDQRGNLFYVDEATGDQKFVSRKVFSKVEIHRRADSPIKHPGKVKILGVDAEGRVIMSNHRGEKFYLDPATGDIIVSSISIGGR